jgi:hypothetical protein
VARGVDLEFKPQYGKKKNGGYLLTKKGMPPTSLWPEQEDSQLRAVLTERGFVQPSRGFPVPLCGPGLQFLLKTSWAASPVNTKISKGLGGPVHAKV